MRTAASRPKASTAMSAERLFTYDELVATMPESNQPCELWDGKLIVAPAPFYGHQRIAFRFQKALHDWVETRQLGEVVGAPIDMVLSPRRVVQPDAVFIARARLGIIKRTIMGAADLVAEVISPGGRTRDRIEKRDLYEQHGIGEYWISDPEAGTVEVLSLVEKQYQVVARCRTGETAASRLLPGFKVDVDSLFRETRE